MTDINVIYASSNDNSLAAQIKTALDGPLGYVVVKGMLPFGTVSETTEAFIQLCHQIGIPRPHDNQQVVWHIKSAPAASGKIQTFSAHNDEAPFHTDAQYRFVPENYFGLLVLKAARCGGGLTSLLTLDSIKQLLSEDTLGEDISRLFTEKLLPFAVPSAFSLLDNLGEKEVVFAHVLTEDCIRYRFDTLIQGLEYFPDLVSNAELNLIRHFDKLINSSSYSINFKLQDRDLLFINNRRTLHRRSPFKDLNRHLLRIRFD